MNWYHLCKKIDPSGDPYSEKSLKIKLLEYFGDSITITEICGKHTIVCISSFDHKVLSDRWYADRKSNAMDERRRVIIAAANIILQNYDCDVYPTTAWMETCSTCSIPETLTVLIESIIMHGKKSKDKNKCSRKCRIIEHAIVWATRPRSFVSPLQIGIGVHLYSKYATKTLLDILCSLGICTSYIEAVRYQSSATPNAAPVIDGNAHLQWLRLTPITTCAHSMVMTRFMRWVV